MEAGKGRKVEDLTYCQIPFPNGDIIFVPYFFNKKNRPRGNLRDEQTWLRQKVPPSSTLHPPSFICRSSTVHLLCDAEP